MTEAELVRELRAEFDETVQELDALIESAAPAAWGAIFEDNGWTTGQIMAHVALATRAYQGVLPSALQSAPAQGGTAEVHHPTMIKMIIRALRRGKAPAPAASVVTRPVTMEEAIRDWHEVRDHMRAYLDAAEGKGISSATFRNPFISLIKMSAADALAVLVAHLSYHRPQLVRRLRADSSS